MLSFLLKVSAILFLFCGTIHVHAQMRIEGHIIDKNTKAAVPYAYIRKKNTNRGAITNEDGFFTLSCEENDTLIISFVSYDKREVPATYFLEHKTLYLKPSKNELSTVEVYANFDFLYALFDKARKKLKQADDYDSKTYFTLETSNEGLPVELLECYYNASIGPSGINELGLKNGRIGMSKMDDVYFASLNTTEIISDYRLFTKADNRFPDNPLHLTKSRLARVYELKLMAFENGVYKIKFHPKKHNVDNFDATFWIHREDQQILKIELEKIDLKRHPFIEIDPKHEIDSINFNIAYTFSAEEKTALEKIEFGYNLRYIDEYQTHLMESAGVFLFFDKNETFDLPYYSKTSNKLYDYDRIVSQPYNKKFWELNEVLSPSRKTRLYKAYFKKVGVLLNFDELTQRNKIFQNRVLPWSENRVLPEEINIQFQEPIYVNGRTGRVVNRSNLGGGIPLKQLYNLSAQIYLDRNMEGDSAYYVSQTLIDLEESFYSIEPDKNTTCFINLYYDMVEIGRKELMEIIDSKHWSNGQVDSIYYTHQYQLDKKLDFFIDAVGRGENETPFKKYIKHVNNELLIDNSVLIWSDYMAHQKKRKSDLLEPWVKSYNQGTSLLRVGKYEVSLPFLLESLLIWQEMYGADENDGDPWILYNIGINYIKLGDIQQGCEYLGLAKERGEEVPAELVSECSK